mmetsp:Transcript_92266/g.287582  ORF Transcript_92266/g.287582 Transcript_92266/m.287582 type:complete len:248 (-) Transcript_92266:217-960(-)
MLPPQHGVHGKQPDLSGQALVELDNGPQHRVRRRRGLPATLAEEAVEGPRLPDGFPMVRAVLGAVPGLEHNLAPEADVEPVHGGTRDDLLVLAGDLAQGDVEEPRVEERHRVEAHDLALSEGGPDLARPDRALPHRPHARLLVGPRVRPEVRRRLPGQVLRKLRLMGRPLNRHADLELHRPLELLGVAGEPQDLPLRLRGQRLEGLRALLGEGPQGSGLGDHKGVRPVLAPCEDPAEPRHFVRSKGV